MHSASNIAEGHALQSVKELHHIFYWFYRTYTNHKDASNHVFNTQLIPAASGDNAKEQAQLLGQFKAKYYEQIAAAERAKKSPLSGDEADRLFR